MHFIARLLLKPKGAQSQVSNSNVTKSAFMSSSNSADVLTEPTGPDLRYCSHELNVFFSLLFMSNVRGDKQDKQEDIFFPEKSHTFSHSLVGVAINTRLIY